jgi:catechol 2,3-dioxygenase-like lactoylglutathione lyase family enzyme
MQPILTHLALHVCDMDASVAFYKTYCGMQSVHERFADGQQVVWLAEPGREQEFIFVLISGGQEHHQAATDYSHFGFALESRAAVDRVAEQARKAGYLAWEPREEPYPVGYYCGVRAPEGTMVEFSYGQPLGPGAIASSPQTSSHTV